METLNIFKTTEEILMFLMDDKLVDNMPKRWRGLSYPKLLDGAFSLHTLIYYANTYVEERESYLKQYLGELERMKSLTRVLHVKKVLTNKQNATLFALYDSVEKQAAAWKKSTKNKAAGKKK